MKRFVGIFAALGLAVPIGLLSLWNISDTYHETLTLLLWPPYALTLISTQTSEAALLLDALAIAANVALYAAVGAALWAVKARFMKPPGNTRKVA
jgi:hypothetical protein